MMVKYRCARCDKSNHVVLHEIFFGTADSKLSKKYNLRVPVCRTCHNWCHNRNPSGGAVPDRNEEQARFFCELMGIYYEPVNVWINQSMKRELLQLSILLEPFLGKYEIKGKK